MTELRWILLLLGVLFIAALAWWEWRRPRRADNRLEEAAPRADTSRHDTPRVPREPTLTLPEIRPPERMRDLPVLEVADESLIGLRAAPEPGAETIVAPSVATIPVIEPAPELPPGTQPIVDWPPEGERRIVALRLVASSNERFAGRTLRLALAAEGFVAGRFSIFHKAGLDGRAILSAASLSKPGTFDPELMDTQRFSGLNLFAVLPGALPPREAFAELLASARNLNDRLLGSLQDAHGEPLTQTRAAAIRDELPA